MLFAHCKDATEAWKTFYTVACLAHPGQGGQQNEFEALVAQARQALADAWPAEWRHASDINLFDVFCKTDGRRNPFGRSISDMPPPISSSDGPAPYECDEDFCLVTDHDYVRPFRPAGASCYAPLAPALGNVELVFCAAAADSSS